MSQRFDRLVEVMTRLRGEGGCPWDRQQTPESLRPFLIEEAYEVLEALESGHAEPLREELGDLLFQVLFHAQIAKETGDFDIEDVLSANIEKMTRRHPHIFSEEAIDLPDAEAVLAHWEAIKRREARHHARTSALDGVPRELPALLQAHKVQSKAARVGFDWKTIEPVFEKIREELCELEEARSAAPQAGDAAVEAELGDLLFSVVNAARHLKINPEDALRRATARFIGRFQRIESNVSERGLSLQSLPQAEMERLWEEARNVSSDL